MDDRIEKLLHENPDLLKTFLESHQDILVDLRARFQTMIASGDMIGRYLMCKALFETIDIQGKVAKEHIERKAREIGYNITDGGTTKH